MKHLLCALLVTVVLITSYAAGTSDTDSCEAWTTALNAASKTGDTVKLAVADMQPSGELGAYAAVFVNDQSERMPRFLFEGKGEENRIAVKAWMLQFCAKNPRAKTMDGIRILAPIVLRDWSVPAPPK